MTTPSERYFGRDNVKGFRAYWSTDNPLLRDNIDAFNRAAQEVGEEAAVWKTWTGQQMEWLGFEKATFTLREGEKGARSMVEVLFE